MSTATQKNFSTALAPYKNKPVPEICILGDWGTSSRRLYLCRRSANSCEILERRIGPGVKFDNHCEQLFAQDVADWVSAHGGMNALLCGMVGSNIGWRDTPYHPCPADSLKIAEDTVLLTAAGCQVYIVPGLRCTNILGVPDIMRGEAIQLVGWHSLAGRRSGVHLLCLPGTHTKWVALDAAGTVLDFITSFQGELFEILRQHSILVADHEGHPEIDERVFLDAVKMMRDTPGISLINALFSTRSKQIISHIDPAKAVSHLGGLLIGEDIKSAKQLFSHMLPEEYCLPILGAPKLCRQYVLAAELFDLRTELYPEEQVNIAGFTRIIDALKSCAKWC